MSMLRKIKNLFIESPGSQHLDLSLDLQQPPEPPEGFEILPPDFVGIGVQKCGTTWWHDLISMHPDVDDSSYLKGQVNPPYLHKERHFFDRFFNREFTDNDKATYTKWFARPKGKLAGEWTPRYLAEHWAPSLLKKAAPDAKLLVMLRDPIDRFQSGMRHAARYKPNVNGNDAHVHFMRGLYYQQLTFWLSAFAKNQILVLQYEKCRQDPKAEINRTLDFLGLEPFEYDSSNFETRKNLTKNEQVYSIDKQHCQSLIDAYRYDVQQLVNELPGIDVSLWKHFSQ